MRRVIFLLFLFSFVNCIAQKNDLAQISSFKEFVLQSKKGKWEQVKEKNNVTISYRSLVLFDSIDTREMSIQFEIPTTTIDSIIQHIKKPIKVLHWNKSLRKNSLLKDSQNEWISYSLYKIPFPFTQQDLVAISKIEKEQDTVIISSKALPNYINTKKGISRVASNFSQWQLVADKGKIKISYSAISVANSNIPRFIKDPIIQRKLLRSFTKFKALF